MSKKVGVTVPDGVYEMLNEEAEEQGRTPANLAAFIIEHHLMFYRYGGLVQHVKLEPKSEVPINVEAIIEKALTGVPLEDGELNTLAKNLSIDPKRLTHFRNQNTKIRSNTSEKVEELRKQI